MFIDGAREQSRSGTTLPILDPATDQAIDEVARAGTDDIEAAIRSSRRAFDDGSWNRISPRTRAQVLSRIAAGLREQVDDFARLETAQTGRPLWDSTELVLSAANAFEYYAGWATKLYGDQIPIPGDYLDVTFREPVGVCVGIAPFNFPLNLAVWKVAPALACGCTIVLKPSELTPLTALKLGELAVDAGLPPGCLNVVVSVGADSEELVLSPLVDKIAFTGSTRTGIRVAELAQKSLKRVSLELGGKSPAIVFADANMERAAQGCAQAIFYNGGQCCDARSRVFVERGVRDEFVEAFVSQARTFTAGEPADPATTLAPLISQSALARVRDYVAVGREEIGEPVLGGDQVDRPGYFFQPTVFTDGNRGVARESGLAREEIFGPVVIVSTFDETHDPVIQANDVPYGLGATVWTADVARALRVARDLKAGNISINEPSLDRVEAPFGGFKQSGYGRECGRYALDLYTETKNVLINLTP